MENSIVVDAIGPNAIMGTIQLDEGTYRQKSHDLEQLLESLGLTVDTRDSHQRQWTVFMPLDEGERDDAIAEIESFLSDS